MSKTPQPESFEVPSSQLTEVFDDRFPVVGIGASAGGLEAFTQLLSHLPADTGMAFVLIQHLAPKQKSLLREILSRATPMSVLEVQDGMVVEPNCVYVIPPDTKMKIARGRLYLTQREQVRGMVMPVDTFFVSLADDLSSKAIAIVLSGGDGDGSRGLEAVKGAGGITFAQRQDSAQVSSMPDRAVATGQVDFILSPPEIAEELANISRHPYVARLKPELESADQPIILDDETALQTIFTLLQTATSVDFTLYKHTTLKRRILRRMVLFRLQSLEDYVIYLRAHPEEVQALYDDVLINVTSFFRDPLAFETLTTTVFPTWADRSSDVPIRIWVAGCSTGEEAYSIAICLLEFLDRQPSNPPIQIYATDISDWAIEKSRSGVYPQRMVADVSPERLHRFFTTVEGGYQISKSVRQLCMFAKQNLCGDPPFSKLDLISCRNVLIYLGATLQRKVLPAFHYGLKPTGFLLLGMSETIGESSDLFALVDKKQKIYAKKPAPVRLTLDLIANTYPSESTDTYDRINRTGSSQPDLQKEADQIVLDRYSPVGVVIDHELEIVHFRGQTSPYLEPAPGQASFNVLKMAKEGLKLELRTAIHQAKQQSATVRKEGLQIRERKQVRQVNLEVIPLQGRGLEERYWLVLFEEALPAAQAVRVDQTRPQVRDENVFALLSVLLSGWLSKLVRRTPNTPKPSPAWSEAVQLQQELATTKEYLQSIIEGQEGTNQDLRVANEEILSSNEELQSSNEELETAKEEIQATNEELSVINDELQRRNFELTQISSDLQNLIGSTNIPILMLSSDLRIRRFTPLAQSILHLIPADVGRPFRDINPVLNLPDLELQILEVIDTLTPTKQEVQDQEGHWYDLRIRPYRTIDNRIDGAIVILVDIDALKRSMEQVQAARNYAQAIVETVQEPLVVLDRNLQVLTANQSYYQMFRVTVAETEQRSLFEIGNGQWNILSLRDRLERILQDRSAFQDFEVERDFEQIGRKIVLLSARIMPQTENGNNILLAIDDITDRKQAEAQLRESEEQLRLFITTTSDIVYRMSADWSEMLTLNGKDFLVSTEISSRTWLEQYIPQADQPQVLAAIQEAIRTKNTFELEHRVNRMDGTVGWTFSHAIPLLDAQNEIIEWFGAASDVTDRKYAETALQESEERLRLATEAADIGMWFWDLTEDRLVWTTYCKQLFGLAPDIEMSYQRFLELLHPDDRDSTHTAVQQAIEQKQEYEIEYRSVWGDGSIHWILAKGRALYNEQDKPVRMMGIAQDISDRKQSEVALQLQAEELSQLNTQLIQTTDLIEQRNEDLNQFAYIVSHDLKAPLRAIANLSVWIAEDLAEQVPPETRQNLDLLRSRVSRMEGLIDGLLSYACIGYEAEPDRQFGLNELLLEIVDSLAIPPQFTVQIPPDLPTITTNRLLLSQVLTNLISNAIKHHDRPDGQVQITAQVQADCYEFTVTDDGPGIAANNHSKVFEIFQTLTSKDLKESTGIGLAIIKKAIERVGGQIELESELGQGATFRFTWPTSELRQS